MITLPNSRILFRDISADDAYTVTSWRNTPDARASFFSTAVVTPDTHRQFVATRPAHDMVWMIEPVGGGDPIGMTGLTIDVQHHTAEYGRAFIAPEYRKLGYAKEQEYLLLWAAFELFRLRWLWLDAFTSNTAIINLHNRTGWRDAGVDLPGHTHARGPVLHMTYEAGDWQQHRLAYASAFGVLL